MKIEDAFVQKRRLWLHLHEKGGRNHDIPCHSTLRNICSLISTAAACAPILRGWLFRTIPNRNRELTRNPMTQSDAYRMIRRRRHKDRESFV